MRSRMRTKFGKIQPWTAELAALERLKKSPLTYNGKDVVNAPAPSLLMGSSSFLQATRRAIRSRMSSKFSEFRPWTAELPALECLKIQYLCCGHSSAFNFDRIFFILGSNKDSHNISDEFEFQPDLTLDCRVICP